MESVQPPGIPGQPPEANRPPQAPDSLRPPNPEVNKPPVDPNKELLKGLENGNKEAAIQSALLYSKNEEIDPGIAMLAAGLVARSTPETTSQLLNWAKEAHRMQAFGGPEGVAIYNSLKEAALSGNQALYDETRRNPNPNVGEAVKALGRDLLLENTGEESYVNFSKFEKPHMTREMIESIQKPQPLSQQKT